VYKPYKKDKGKGKGAKKNPKHQVKDKKAHNRSKRIDDNEPCPVHKDSDHTWGECYSNHFGKNHKGQNGGKKKTPKKGASSEDKIDSNAMEVSEKTVIAPAWRKKIKEAAAPKRQVKIMEEVPDDDDEEMIEGYPAEEYVAQLCDELNNSCDGTRPSNFYAELKAKQAFDKAERKFLHELCDRLNDVEPADASMMVAEYKAAKAERLVAFEESIPESDPVSEYKMDALLSALSPHHLTSSIPALQRSNEVIISVAHEAHEDDVGSPGVNENNTVLPFDALQRLRSTSFAIVHTMQQQKTNCLLRVLFDSGADSTLIARTALPQGILPSEGKKRKVTGVTAT
jgi:hypothetical protein